MSQKYISVEDYKLAMRQLAFPVVVITVAQGNELRGVTIGSLTSVSVDPPTLCFNLTTPSRMNDLIQEVDTFAVNMLASGQKELSNWFANQDLVSKDQMGKFPYKLSPEGLPILDGASGYVLCEITDRFLHLDHTVIFGKAVSWMEGTGDPLVYFGGKYRRLGEEL